MLLSVDGWNRAAEVWRTYFFAASWQSAVVALTAIGLTLLFRRWPAAVRAAILLVALVKFLVPPIVPSPAAVFRGAAPPAVVVPGVERETIPVRSESVVEMPPADRVSDGRALIESKSTTAPPPVRLALSLNAILLLAHVTGTVAILGWLIWSTLRLRRLIARSEIVDSGPLHARAAGLIAKLQAPATEIRLSDATVPPMACGIFRPRILLPRAIVDRLSPEDIDVVLAHELAHVRRRDTLVTHLQLLVLAAWWFNPMAWILSQQLRRTREECCDDIVLGEGIAGGETYCQTMLNAAEHLVAPPLSRTLGVSEAMHPLGDRIKRIMDSSLGRRSKLPIAVVLALLLVMAVIVPVRLVTKEPAARTIAIKDQSAATVTATTKPAGDNRIAGLVTKQDGTPLGDAQVYLMRRGIIYGKAHPQVTRSAADGSFGFDGLARGEYRLWALSGHLRSQEKPFGDVVKAPQTPADAGALKLVMRPGRVLHLAVTTDGKPLAGATVSFGISDMPEDYKTDDSGKVTIGALPSAPMVVSVTGANKAKVMKNVNLASSAETSLEVTLADGGSVSGKVLDAQGKPVVGSGINAYPGTDGTPIAYVQSAADGSYKIENLPLGGKIRIYANSKSYAPYSQSIDLSAAQRDRSFDIKLDPKPPGGSVEGTVVDANDKPLSDAIVTCYDLGSDDSHHVKTDAAGHFRIDNIESQRNLGPQITARAKGWAPMVVSVAPGTAQAPATLAIKMTDEGHSIDGRVVDEKHQPIKGAYVYAGGNRYPMLFGGRIATDAQGRFHFDSLPAQIDFAFYAEGFSEREARPAMDGIEPVDIVMQAMGAIVGTVVDAETNQAIGKFNIRLRESPDLKPGEPYPSLGNSEEKTGADFSGGAFRLDNLQAGTSLTLVVSADGYPVQYFDSVHPSPGGKGEATVIRLAKHPADNFPVAGVLTDQAGKPLAGINMRAVVYSLPANDESIGMRFHWGMLKSGQLAIQRYIRSIESTKTGADGSFSFDSIKGDDFDLAYWGEGVSETRVPGIGKLPAEQREHLKLSPPGAGSIAGRINRKAYLKLSGIFVKSTTDESYQMEIKFSDAQGTYKIDPVPAGQYKIFLEGPAENANDPGVPGAFYFPRVSILDAAVKSNAPTQVDLGFGPTRTVSGTVTQDGKPWAGCNIDLIRDDQTGLVRTARTDANGAYKIEFVDPAKYRMFIIGAGKLGLTRRGRPLDVKAVDASERDIVQDFQILSHPTSQPTAARAATSQPRF